MNNRSWDERSRHGEWDPTSREERGQGRGPNGRSDWSRGQDQERWAWQSGREDERRWQGSARERQFSSDYDETYGSEWERGRDPGTHFGPQRSGSSQYPGGYTREEHDGAWRGRGNVGMYGAGSRGGYSGGRGSSDYGGGTGTDYGGGSFGGYSGSRAQGGGYERGFSGGRDQGYRGPDLASPGTSLRSNLGGGFAGRGPKGYTRTDDRIREDVCDRLSLDDDVDASDIEVRVQNGEVTLEGSVQTRRMKHQAEDIAEAVPGVRDVHNSLRVTKGMMSELKDKLTGKESEQHHAGSGTKSTPAVGASGHRGSANGTL